MSDWSAAGLRVRLKFDHPDVKGPASDRMLTLTMLLCAINDVAPGSILGSVVSDPQNPGHDLLRPGVELHAALLRSVARRGVTRLWIEDDLTRDLDAAVAPRLSAAKKEVYAQIRDGLEACTRRTISTAQIQSYRAAVMELVLEAISSAKYASMTEAIFDVETQASHATNVAYLSLLCGLHLEPYVINEQPRLRPREAREMSVLGLAGMLHDVGKTQLSEESRLFHDVQSESSGGARQRPVDYPEHVAVGKQMLEACRVPARVAYSVLHHHQRFDGQGWPDMSHCSNGRLEGTIEGRRIHIFARIIAAANVLDGLLTDAEGHRLQPVAALHAFASERFDGWFDPLVRRALLKCVPPFSVGTDVRLSDGRRAVVVEPEPDMPCRPGVRPIDAGEGDETHVSLMEHPDLSITHALGEDVSSWIFEPPSAPADAEQGEDHEAGIEADCVRGEA